MSETDQVLSVMNELKVLLEDERETLIQNNGEHLVEIVQEKEELLERLAEFDEKNVNVNELLSLSHDIKEIQETNLLLTQQSLAYTEMLLQNIQKNSQKKNAYSKKGTFEKSEEATFLDESL